MPWLKPVTAEMFVDKYDPAPLRGLEKFIARAPGCLHRNNPASHLQTGIRTATLFQAAWPVGCTFDSRTQKRR